MKWNNTTINIDMARRIFSFLLGAFVLCGGSLTGCKDEKHIVEEEEPKWMAASLAGTDDLGRVLLQNEDVGDPKSNRQVAMFYFLWQGHKGSVISPDHWNLSEITVAYPEILEDNANPNWGGGFGSFYYWGKPIYGYYRGDEYWVHLRSMQLLADAMVDFVVIDATNAYIYEKEADVLMSAMDAVRAQGKEAPKIVFYTNTESGERMQQLYDNFYKPGAPYSHPACWFYLENKPLVIGKSAEAEGHDYRNFFTFRESQWPNEPQVANGWPWISFTRPPKVHRNSKGKDEIINVAVAQHPNWEAGMGGSAFYGNTDNRGRSYRNGSRGNPATDIAYGYNIQEQWDYAIEQNTPFVFVTGWNEWVAGRWPSMDGNPKHSWFCDLATPEFSRDIEPSLSAGMKDSYYMQLVNNIRRYKGVNKQTAVSPRSITAMSEWDKVQSYSDYVGDTQARNYPSALSEPATVYTNTTGRNDFRTLKVAHDAGNLYFYAETVNDFVPETLDDKLQLLLDSDRKAATGRHGFDFRVIAGNTLQQYTGSSWKTIQTLTPIREKSKLMFAIPRELLFAGSSSMLNFEFKWSDNMQEDDPLDWYVNGDAAPGGRFNFIYNGKPD